jgi:hypothetical protein
MADEVMYVPFETPEDFSAGLLPDSLDAEILEAIFTKDPPPNYTTADGLFFRAKLRNLADGAESPQYWSCGSGSRYEIVDNGKLLTAVTAGERLTTSCKFYQFMGGLHKCGLKPKSLTIPGVGVSALVGTTLHLKKETSKTVGGADSMVYVPTHVSTWGWEKAAAKAAKTTQRKAAATTTATPAAVAAPAPAAVAQSDGEVDDFTVLAQLRMQVEGGEDIDEIAGSSMALYKIGAMLYPNLSGTARSSIVKRLNNPEQMATVGLMMKGGRLVAV